jgi:tetratricopeptide (TPR) repeat protein
MAREFFNDRRKSLPTAAGYQQLAGQVAKPDATPLTARELGSKAAKQPTRGVDALRASPTASGGLPWALLGLVAILLAVALGVAFVLWPSSKSGVATESRAERSISTSAQAQSDARPSSLPLAADNAPPSVKEMPPAPPAGDWEQLLARGAEQARARQWPQAAAAFAAALRIHPDDHWHWFRAATLLAWTKDQSAYRRHCAEMLQRFGETTHPNIAERTAKACLLIEGAADMKTVVRLADQAVAATDHPDHLYFLLARGLAHYRAGEFDKALEQASKAISGNPKVIGLDTPAHLVVAMSHHQLGQAAEASKALGQAREIMGQDWFPKLESGELADAWWHDWLICQILHREAAGLIEGKKGP